MREGFRRHELAMTDNTGKFITANSGNLRSLSALAVTCLLAGALAPATIAFAQDAQQPNGAMQPAPAQPAAAQPPQPGQPAPTAAAQPRGLFPAQPAPAHSTGGFIYAFGRWWDDAHGGLADLTKQPSDATRGAAAPGHDPMQGAVEATEGAASATQDALKNAAQATRDAATALFRLPGLRVVEVHQRCSVAPNGAPDCRMAATNACRARGFSDGHPVDVQSSENCPPAVWMSGNEPAAGECAEETVVLMVACQ
jgi:hypothetical protein